MKKHHAWILYALLTGAYMFVPQKSLGAERLRQSIPIVVERGPHHRVVMHVTEVLGPDGSVSLRTNKYTELGAGMHYRQNGQWVESKEEIDIVPGGALASKGAHQVGFAANINTPGSINMLTGDGKRLRSHVLGVAYTDAKTGQSVLIAQLKDSTGERVGNNQIIYRDAFLGLTADVKYTYTHAGFEQDIVLLDMPPTPDTYGLDPATTRLEVFTEFLEAPTPQVKETKLPVTIDPAHRAAGAIPDFIDQTLNFGAMQINAGQAFPVEGDNDGSLAVPTGKTWQQLDGRLFLIEAVQYPSIKPQLETLRKVPLNQQAFKIQQKRTFPAPPLQAHNKTDATIRMAAAGRQEKGFVIDYAIMTGVSNFTFRGDTTYYVGNPVPSMTGTAVIEGGAVIKYTNGVGTPMLRFIGSVDCRTTPYHPAIATSMHDDTVGDTIVGSTGNPTNYCGYMMYLGNSSSNYFNLHDIYVSHAYHAFYGTAKVNADISNCQVFDSNFAFKNNTAFWNLRNILVGRIATAFEGTGSPHTNNAEHLTFYAVSNLVASDLPAIRLTNSLLIRVTNGVSYTGAYVQTNLSGSGVFQTVGSGAFYLADNSAYRDVGTTNITPSLLTALRQRTTFPPQLLSGMISDNLVLGPVVQRDTDLPDLGYHYDPIDYLFQNVAMTNASLLLTNGVCIGITTNSTVGIQLCTGALLSSGSSPGALNRVFRTECVQEQRASGSSSTCLIRNTDSTGINKLRFIDLPITAGGGSALDTNSVGQFDIVDSQFRGGVVRSYGNLTLLATNTLFERVNLNLDTTNGEMHAGLYGCLVRGGPKTVLDNHWSGSTMEVFNTLFESASNIVYEPSLGSTNGFNGYYNTTVLSNSVGHVVLTNLTWQTGPFGSYYQPTNSSLIDRGTNTADSWGYYHYTVTTNNVKEGTTTVDIGLHYVATDSFGQPIDSDGDGLADYVEDRNGNGIYDSPDLANFLDPDTDNDGQTDPQELASGTDPKSANSVIAAQLGSWLFNAAEFTGDQGQTPLVASNVALWPGFHGNDVRVDNALLQYAGFENGLKNITFAQGTIAFWIRPLWQSGVGPGNSATLIGSGTSTVNASYGYFAITIDSTGDHLSLISETAGSRTTHFSAPIYWNAGAWYHVVITYDANGTQLLLDGTVITNGTGVQAPISSSVLSANGFTVGSDPNGNNQAHAEFDELQTFNCVNPNLTSGFNAQSVSQTACTYYPISFNVGDLPAVPPAGGVEQPFTINLNSGTFEHQLHFLSFSGDQRQNYLNEELTAGVSKTISVGDTISDYNGNGSPSDQILAGLRDHQVAMNLPLFDSPVYGNGNNLIGFHIGGFVTVHLNAFNLGTGNRFMTFTLVSRNFTCSSCSVPYVSPPIPAPGNVTIQEDQIGGIGARSFNVDDPNDHTLSHLVVFAVSSDKTLVPEDASHLTLQGSGTTRTINVIPAADQNGSVTITVWASNTTCHTASSVQFNVVVTPVNDAPTLTAVTTLDGAVEDTPFTISYDTLAAVANAADIDGPSLHFRVGSVTSGTLTKNNAAVVPGTTLLSSGESWVWTPAQDANGTALSAFTVVAWDGSLPSPTPVQVKVNVSEVNDPPVPGTHLVNTPEDTTLTLSVANLLSQDTAGPANERNDQHLTLTLDSTTTPHGTVSLNGSSVVYMPAENYNGQDSFTYTIHDDGTTGGSSDPRTAVATVSINVTEVNDPPIANGDILYTHRNTPVSFTLASLLNNDLAGPANESSSQVLSIEWFEENNIGGYLVYDDWPTIMYVPFQDYHGTDSFVYAMFDNGTTAGTADPQGAYGLVQVIVNDPPTISSIADQTTPEDTPLVVPFSIGDDSGTPTITASSSDLTLVPSANLTFRGNGSSRKLVIIPAENKSGSTTITITATDTEGAVTTETFTLTVTPVNDAPALSVVGLPLDLARISGLTFENARCLAVSADGNKTCVGDGSHLEIIDSSTANAPQLLGTWIDPDDIAIAAVKISQDGRTAFVGGAQTIRVIDISTPSSPVLLNTAGQAMLSVMAGTITDMVLSPEEEILYLATGYDTFWAFDVSDKTLPVAIGFSPIGENAQSICISANGRTAYLADESLLIYDVTHVEQTVLIGSFGLSCSKVALSHDGTRVYAASGQQLHILNISNPNAITDAAWDVQDQLRDIVLDAQGNKAYLLLNSHGLEVLDISNPDQPVFKGIIAAGTPKTFALSPSRNTIWMSQGSAGLSGFDVGSHKLTLLVNHPSSSISLQLDDVDTSANLLSLSAQSSFPRVIPVANVVLNGTTLSRSTVITPAQNDIGQSTVTVQVSDGALISHKNININVAAVNEQPPIVNAGPDQTITLPASAVLNGTASDDGLPSGILLVSWVVVSGPGAVRLSAVQNSPSATAYFTKPGVYTLRLQASDSLLSASDDIVVTVLKPNTPPIVYAGPNQTIEEGEFAYLPGTVTDDGDPAGIPPVATWAANGPGTVTFDDPHSAATFASFSAAGTYVLQLSAQDGDPNLAPVVSQCTITVTPPTNYQAFYHTKYVSAGVGGMRGYGDGAINISGLSGTVLKAYLYWHGPTDSYDPDVNASILVNGRIVQGKHIGESDNNAWHTDWGSVYANSRSYRADVTALITTFRDGIYTISGAKKGTEAEVNGASLLVFCDDPTDTTLKDVYVWDGNDSNNKHDFSLVGTVNAIAKQGGKSILGGDFVFSGLEGTSTNIIRITSSGAFDETFPGLTTDGAVTALAQQANGDIIVAGRFSQINGQTRYGLARLSSDGLLDTSFAPLESGSVATCIAIDSHNKLVIGGTFTVSGQYRNGIARLNSDGTVDQDFLTAVVATGAFPANAVAIQSDGKVLVGGSYGVKRFGDDGHIDQQFNALVQTPVNCIAIQADSKIILGGSFDWTENGVLYYRLARVNSNGGADSTFHPTFSSSISSSEIFTILLSGTDILIGGRFNSVNGTPRSAIAKLSSGGSVDQSFVPAIIERSSSEPAIHVISSSSSAGLLIAGYFDYADHVAMDDVALLTGTGGMDHSMRSGDDGWNINFTQLGQRNASGELELHVSDGQHSTIGYAFYDPVLYWTGQQWRIPGVLPSCDPAEQVQMFMGESVPHSHHDCSENLYLWDLRSFPVTVNTLNGATPSLSSDRFKGLADGGYDALSLVVAALKLPSSGTPSFIAKIQPPVNLHPVARHDISVINGGLGAGLLNVLSNDSSSDGTILSIASFSTPSHGSAEVVANNSALRYIAAPDYSGNDSLTYVTVDRFGNTATGTVSVAMSGTRPQQLPEPADFGQTATVSGELSITSGRSVLHGPNNYADFYRVHAKHHETLTFAFSSSAFGGHLYLWNANGELIKNTAHQSSSLSASLSVVVEEAGDYVIEVTSHSPLEHGHYTLAFTRVNTSAHQLLAWVFDNTEYRQSSTIDFGILEQGEESVKSIELRNIGETTIDSGSVSGFNSTGASVSFTPSSVLAIPPTGYSPHTITISSSTVGVNEWLMGYNRPEDGANLFYVHAKVYVNPPGELPDVYMISPLANQAFAYASSIPLSANAIYGAGIVSKIEFFAISRESGSKKIGEVGVSGAGPYSISWLGAMPGAYEIFARATNAGRLAESAHVKIVVSPPIANSVPKANDDFVAVAVGKSGVFDVLRNDFDADGDLLKIVNVSLPVNGGTAEIRENGRRIFYVPPPDIFGDDQFAYTVSDGKNGFASATVTVKIVAGQVEIVSPADETTFTFGSPSTIPISASASTREGAITRLQFFVNGSRIYDTVLPTATVNWTPSAVGIYSLKVVASSQNNVDLESSAVTVHVTSPGDHPPLAVMANVGDFQVIREARFPLFGTVDDADIGDTVNYTVKLYRTDDGSTLLTDRLVATLVSASNQRIQNGLLGDLDFTAVQNGPYELVLQVNSGGAQASQTAHIIVNNTAKIGQLRFSETDLSIPVGGVALSVIRTFDSLQNMPGDFGYNWSFTINDLAVEIDEQRQLTHEDSIDPNDPQGDLISMRVGGWRDVTLTLPDGNRTTFAFSLEPGPSDGDAPCFCYVAKWTPPPNVHAKLTPTDNNVLQFIPFQPSLEGIPPFWQATGPETPMENFDFSGFTLELANGTKYDLVRDSLGEIDLPPDGSLIQQVTPRGDAKLKRIRLLDGQRIEIGPGEIAHYDPAGAQSRKISIIRDGGGQILKIRDPKNAAWAGSDTTKNASVEYEYFSTGDWRNGNLHRVKHLIDHTLAGDAAFDITEYDYALSEHPHFVTSKAIVKNGNQVAKVTYSYADGRLAGAADSLGRIAVSMTHSLSDRKEYVTDIFGNTTVHEYDNLGNVVRTTDALGRVVTRTSDESGNILSETDPLGHTVTYQYDSNGNRTRTTDALNNFTSATFDSAGHLLTLADPKANAAGSLTPTTANQYDAFGNLLWSVDAHGVGVTNVYDANQRLHFSTNVLGQLTEYNYFPNGDIHTVTVSDSAHNLLHVTAYTYDANGNRETETTSRDGTSGIATTTYIYDDQNRVTEVRDPEYTGGNTHRTTTQYNELGRASATTDKLGRVTQYVYDSLGNLSQTIYPTDTTTPLSVARTVYDAANRPIYVQDKVQVSDPSGDATVGLATHNVYDPLGRVIRTERLSNVRLSFSAGTASFVSADGPSSWQETTFDAAGRVSLTTASSGDRREYTYDDAGRRVAVTVFEDDGTPRVSRYGYDANGNQIAFTDALNRTTEYHYDELNRRTSVEFPPVTGESTRTTKQTGYDALGRRISETDQNEIVTRFGYDDLNRLVAVTNDYHVPPTANPFVTRYEYDDFGNLAHQIDANNHVTKFEYNKLGQRTKRTLPAADTQFESFTYDGAGNLETHTDFKGITITFEYDVLNRLVKRRVGSAVLASFGYFPSGQRQNMRDASGATIYTYDFAGRLFDKKLYFDWPASGDLPTDGVTHKNATLRYSYGNNGRLKEVHSLGDGAYTTYNWDGQGRLMAVTNYALTTWSGAKPNAQYSYDAVGNLHSTSFDVGVTTVNSFDDLNRLRSVQATRGNSLQVIAKYDYTLDNAGNRSTVTDLNGRSVTYGYDNLYRLKRETIANDPYGYNGEIGYIYDNVGNRKSRTLANASASLSSAVPPVNNYDYDADDRLAPDTSGYGYDANGNTTSSPSGNSDVYDNENHLVNRDNGQVQFVYDGDGNRVKKTTTSGDIYYIIDDLNPTGYPQVIEERNWVNDGFFVMRAYTYGHSILSTFVPRQPESVRFFVQDGHGSVRMMVGEAGATVEAYDYDAFGNALSTHDGSGNPISSLQNNYLFAGEQWDQSLGMYYNRARYMAPAVGRFWTMDTFEGDESEPIASHRYLYTADNPVNGIDPSGLRTYLIFYGEDTTTIFADEADRHAKQIREWKRFNPANDKVVIVKAYTVAPMKQALLDNVDIGYIAYIGHGGPGALYVGIPSGAQYNLSPNGGKAGDASDSTAVTTLPSQNVRSDATAALFSCYSAASDGGQGGVSIAEAFANHFGIRVLGAGAGVGFGKEGPYIRNWRIVEGWRERLLKGLRHGGGWQIVDPERVEPIMP